MQLRLNKFIAESGVCSRRGADELIVSGQVEINGSIVNSLGTKIEPEIDKVTISGKPIRQRGRLVYYAAYKPVGMISTASDEAGRAKITDLVPAHPRVYPIGRLDAYSEGLVILTNDGEITQRLTHPSFEYEKEYEVTAHISSDDLRKNPNPIGYVKKSFLEGLKIEGKLMKADKVFIKENERAFILNMVLHTGYNRQIRKMCGKIGLAISKIKRMRIGKLKLISLQLKAGESKQITKEQII